MTDDASKRVIEVYNTIASEYYKIREKMILSQEMSDLCLHLKKGASILDAGCGNGRDAIAFYERGFSVTAIDFSEGQLAMARKREGIENIRLEKQDILHLSLEPATFDAIWCCAVLPHFRFDDVVHILQSFYRILKPGGKVCFTLKKGHGEQLVEEDEFGGIKRFIVFYSENDVAEMARMSRFTVLGLTQYNERQKFSAHNRDMDFLVCLFHKPNNHQ